MTARRVDYAFKTQALSVKHPLGSGPVALRAISATVPVDKQPSQQNHSRKLPKNRPELNQKSSKSQQQIRSWGLLGSLGELLEGSWRGLGAILAPRSPKSSKRLQQGTEAPLAGEGSWGPKSTKID